MAAVALVLAPVATAGCAFEGQIAVQFVGDGPTVVMQSIKGELTPSGAQGTTTRKGQVVRIDCSVTGVFDVRRRLGDATSLTLPHLFGGIRSYGEATRTLSCAA